MPKKNQPNKNRRAKRGNTKQKASQRLRRRREQIVKQEVLRYKFPKASLTVFYSPKMDKSSTRPKRLCFRCEGCEINFAKFESLEVHRKSYCNKKLNISLSSTITTGALINTNLPSSGTPMDEEASRVTHPLVEELHSAMAIKRSFLEASVKTAVDAQYIINLHKAAQRQTQKAFKELDEILNWEKALTETASLEEHQHVSTARSQALIRAESAYMEEKHSGAAVEQALYRQKASIEAAVMATSHEQVALIAALKSLKVQADESSRFSSFQFQRTNVPTKSSFTEEPVIESPKEKIAVVTDVAFKSSPERKLFYIAESPKSFTKQK